MVLTKNDTLALIKRNCYTTAALAPYVFCVEGFTF